MTYQEFFQTKIEIATESGFDIEPSQLNKALMPRQRAGVAWALREGRRTVFESFGLGKTVQEFTRDGVGYLKAARNEIEMPTLFDFMGGSDSSD